MARSPSFYTRKQLWWSTISKWYACLAWVVAKLQAAGTMCKNRLCGWAYLKEYWSEHSV